MSGNEKRGKAVRGFVRGVLWGSLAAAGGLVVVSQVAGPVPVQRADLGQSDAAPLAVPVGDSPESAAPEAVALAPVEAAPLEPEAVEPAPAAEEAEADLPDAVTPDAPLMAPEAPASSDSADAQAGLPVLPGPADVPPSAVPQTAVPQSDALPANVTPPAEPPVAPPSEAPAGRMATAGQVNPLPDAPAPGDAPMTTVQPGAPGLPQAEGAPAPADLPPPPPLTPDEEALLLPLPDDVPEDGTEATLVDPTPEPMPLPEPLPEQPVPAPAEPPSTGQGSLIPAPELRDQAAGVVTGRLPRIGVDPAPGSAGDPVAVTDAAGEDDATPLRRYARPFNNATQKPLFAILLQDDGEESVNRAELAALDLPLSIVIDPLSDGAAARAAIWRAGGQEVVMAGTGIPVGAGPGDLEQSFQVLASRLPEAVAVIDADGSAFQNDRPRAAQVVPILAEQGRGLVTFDQGLNAADQVARREGLPAATIFRRIDGEGEDSPVIRRYLDRAAFKAAQEGRVIVIGTLRPETVAGVLEWAIEGRASTVTLAPISAMLQVN